MDTSIQFSRDDLVLLNNALNEVCNGVHIEEPEFHTRLGATKEEARELLSRINSVLRQ